MGLGSGPCLTLFCMAEQTAAGRKRKRGEARIEGSAQGTGALFPAAGWVAQTPEVQREPFLFSVVRMGAAVVVWGGGLCPPSGGTVQGSPHLSTPSLLSHKTTVTHSHMPVHPSPVPDQLGVRCVL